MIALILAATLTLPPGRALECSTTGYCITVYERGIPCLTLEERQAMAVDAQRNSWIALDGATRIESAAILQAAGRDTSGIYMGDATPEGVRQRAQAAQGIAEALRDLPTCAVAK